MGMIVLSLLPELYMLSGCWARDAVLLPETAITLLFAMPLVSMTAIVVIVVVGAFGKEPNLGIGNLAGDTAGETVIQ